MMARINSPLSQFVADGFGCNPPVWRQTRLWCLAGFAVTTWHNIHVAMRTLPMTMNPHNIFRPPARWALRLQDWLWLGVSGVWRLLLYLRLVYLGQIGHPALGWSASGVGQIIPQNANRCKTEPSQIKPLRNR